jgi:hypothetical protein
MATCICLSLRDALPPQAAYLGRGSIVIERERVEVQIVGRCHERLCEQNKLERIRVRREEGAQLVENWLAAIFGFLPLIEAAIRSTMPHVTCRRKHHHLTLFIFCDHGLCYQAKIIRR